jgi:hypothetical protein
MIANPNASVLNAYVVLAGSKPSATSYAGNVEFLNAYGEDAYIASLEESYADLSDAAMGVNVLKALGIADIFTTAQAEAFYADNAGNRVKATLDLANVLSNYSGTNATIQAAKTAYNAKVEAASEYASNPENTEDEAIVGGSGQTFTLTLGAATEDQDFSARDAGGVITIDGDDDATDGDDFSITGTDYDDTFIPSSFKDLTIQAGAGIDTIDLSELEPGAGDADISLVSGVTNSNLSPGSGTTFLLGFENVIASNDGGRIVGTSGANVITLGEGTDDVVASAGDDTIIGTDDTFTTATDTIDGGTGTDTVRLSGGDTLTVAQADFSSVEVLEFTGEADDITITAADLFDGAADPTSGITTGVKEVVLLNGDENEVTLTAAANSINLLGVSFEGVQTLTVNASAGNNLVAIDSGSLSGIETLTGQATDVLTPTGAGTFDFSGVDFDTLTEITARAATSDQTFIFSELGDIADIDVAGGNDVIRGGGTLTLDLTGLTALEGGTGKLELQFGSASVVVINGGTTGSDEFTSFVGTSADSDVLVLGDGTGAVTGALATMTDIETITIDDGGAGSTITVDNDTLSAGMTVVGDSGDDTLVAGEDDVDLTGVTLVDIESFDLDGNEATGTMSVLGSVELLNGTADAVLTITDTSGALDFGALAADMELDFSSDDGVTVSIGDLDDTAGGLDITFGSGDDSLDVTDSDISNDAASAVSLGAGNDSYRFGTTIANGVATGGVAGGAGTDTLLVEGNVAAAAIAATSFTGFETLKLATSQSGNLSIALGATDVQVSTVDISADTDTDGANTVDLSAFTKSGVTIIGSLDADTITTGTSTTTVLAGAGNDTVTVTAATLATAAEAKTFTLSGQGGNDTFDLGADWATAGVGQHSIVIADYTGDTIDLSGTVVAGGAATEIAQTVAQAIVDAASPTTIAAAFEALNDHATALSAEIIAAFQFEGNTYIYVDGDSTSVAYDSTEDFYIVLTGLVDVDMDDVTAF